MDHGAAKRQISRNEPNPPEIYHLIDPAVSEAQRRYLYMKFGAAWVKKHHMDNKGHLPMHVRRKK